MNTHFHAIRLSLAAVMLAALAATAGCGNKGALFLPEAPAAEAGAAGGQTDADDESGERDG